MLLGDCAPLEIGKLLPDYYVYQKILRVSPTVQGGRLVTTQADGLVEIQAFERGVSMEKRRQCVISRLVQPYKEPCRERFP